MNEQFRISQTVKIRNIGRSDIEMRFLTHDSKISCIDDNGREVGKIIFPKRENNVYEIKTTKVDESMQGQGIAGKLMRLCLNEINHRGGTVRATCS